MRQRQLLTFGLEDKLAQRLHELLQDHGVGLRITRHSDACLNLLRQGAIGVLLLRVGRDLLAEYTLLEQVAREHPRVVQVVIGDLDHPQLTGLAWDLGARCVVEAPGEPEQLRDVVLKALGEK